ncbi:phosphonate C-P lyase system protein PhnH [Frigidibacter sp. ROC022]|uniref:phosphonate C-P lyase system protein PhnH n=1 Tax=Frigidibacter sp. ROC022 TaxID=2971796 RepID=UPI00215A8943|nr:phosphonate C-P lyase system protein PhnH [Frigidibacter sp. ROC022]MCR8725035.1 phosphonate C-P lyase system protein PhnH [Frigidibacter sp. ROC022]
MTVALTGAFADPPRDAARAFRGALRALSRPGTIVTLAGAAGPAPLSPAAAALLLTLADATTPLHLAGAHDCAALRDWVRFHCGAPLTGAEDAAFALGTWPALAPLDRYRIGTPDYPDRAATLIVEVEDLTPDGARLSGPGIRGQARLSLPETAAFRANHDLFPLGWDCFLTAGERLAGLPRSTQVEAA